MKLRSMLTLSVRLTFGLTGTMAVAGSPKGQSGVIKLRQVQVQQSFQGRGQFVQGKDGRIQVAVQTQTAQVQDGKINPNRSRNSRGSRGRSRPRSFTRSSRSRSR